ncbi:MAG: tetratricopeptide repeat protein [Polyangiaceae bacterium]
MNRWMDHFRKVRSKVDTPGAAACLDLELARRTALLDHLACADAHCQAERLAKLETDFASTMPAIDHCADAAVDWEFQNSDRTTPEAITLQGRALAYLEFEEFGPLDALLLRGLQEHAETSSDLHQWLQALATRLLLGVPEATRRAVAESTALVAIAKTDAQKLRAQTLQRDALSAAGRRADALRKAKRLAASSRATLGTNHARTAEAYTALGDAEADLQQYSRARASYSTALAALKVAWGTESLQAADGYARLGTVAAQRGQNTEALKHFRRATHILQMRFPNAQLAEAALLRREAELDRSRNDFSAAAKKLKRALRLQTAILGERHLEVARTLFDLGRCYLEEGNHVLAKSTLDRAASAVPGPLVPLAIEIAISRTDTQIQRGSARAKLTETFADLLSLLRWQYGNAHPLMVSVLVRFAQVGSRQSRLTRAVDISEATNGPLYPGNANLYKELGDSARRGDPFTAEHWHARYAELLEALPDTPKPLLAEAYVTLAMDQLRAMHGAPLELAVKAQRLQRESLPDADPAHARTCEVIGRASAEIELYEAALGAFECARTRSVTNKDGAVSRRVQDLIHQLCRLGHKPACASFQGFREASRQGE